ncbi:hypothetical protein [Polyangium mundeleinium]|uniref:Uncharacterized protein n=1 Tax=Polyangium mundeleinium TaxID=2995306 RepID=A0ABT5EG93_9BACT|nr:hypothetical protein [Polyangium mundeleinium]MDC0740852.1 hypothetical protein [Polyangium mundeleinium]
MSVAPHMDDDDVATTVTDRSALPPQSGTRPSLAHSEPPRDTVVDAPSAWSRAHAALGAALRSVCERFRKARLADRLPPLPPLRSMTATHVSVGTVVHDERGEQLLLDLVRAARPYQNAAVYVANYAVVLRKLGDDAYAEGLLHFALSRMRPDAEGFVSVARLRDRLPELSYSGTLVPALTRLEAAGIVTLTGTTEGGTMRVERVLLRVPL